jgi:prevent-host-death family protein
MQTMRTLTLAETKSHLSAVVDQVVAGEEIIITRRGRPVARIIPERERPALDTSALVDDMRDFVLSQPLQTRPATQLVREVRDGERY